MTALRALALSTLLLGAVAHSSVAATKTSVRAAGMGGAYTAVAEGVQATQWNPANLGFADSPAFALELFSTRAGIANNGIDLDLYNRTVGAHLDEADKRAILSSIPSDGLRTSLEAGASVLGFQMGQLALSFSGEASAYSRLPHQVFQLVLLGNAAADSIDFSQAEGEAISYAAARLSAATTLGETAFGRLHLGLTLSYLEGLAYGKLEKVEGSLVTRPTGILGRAEALLTTAGRGQGFGVDLGLASELGEHWRAGLAMENAYGRIHFESDLEQRSYVASTDTLDIVTIDETSSADSLYSTSDLVEKIDPFSVDLPRILRFGLARQGERTTLAWNTNRASPCAPARPPLPEPRPDWNIGGWAGCHFESA